MLVINRNPNKPVIGLRRVMEFGFSYSNHFVDRGGYGHVLVQKGRNGRRIAIKVDNEGTYESEYGNIFIGREAKALLRFDHPNIIACLGWGKYYRNRRISDEQRLFLALEFIGKRKSANEYVEGSNDKISTAIYLLEKIAGALAYIHDLGWDHADLSIQNIIGKGRIIKLIDFAWARKEGERIYPEKGNWVCGVPAYWSLSRLKKNPPTRADDIHALGILACELLIGKVIQIRTDNLIRRINEGLSDEETFENAQRETEEKIKASGLPEPIKDLLRGMIGAGGRKQFTDCHEMLGSIENIRREMLSLRSPL